MDKNKLTVLREAGYTIPNCVHGQFDGGGLFGTCVVRTYQHLKHTGEPRQLSVFAHGGCEEKFDLRPEIDSMLGAWAEFLDKREYSRSTRHKAKTRY